MYKRTYLEDIIEVESVVTMHYFEFAKDYVFKGEKHESGKFFMLIKDKLKY